jgi:hypothetical protein
MPVPHAHTRIVRQIHCWIDCSRPKGLVRSQACVNEISELPVNSESRQDVSHAGIRAKQQIPSDLRDNPRHDFLISSDVRDDCRVSTS